MGRGEGETATRTIPAAGRRGPWLPLPRPGAPSAPGSRNPPRWSGATTPACRAASLRATDSLRSPAGTDAAPQRTAHRRQEARHRAYGPADRPARTLSRAGQRTRSRKAGEEHEGRVGVGAVADPHRRAGDGVRPASAAAGRAWNLVAAPATGRCRTRRHLSGAPSRPCPAVTMPGRTRPVPSGSQRPVSAPCARRTSAGRRGGQPIAEPLAYSANERFQSPQPLSTVMNRLEPV